MLGREESVSWSKVAPWHALSSLLLIVTVALPPYANATDTQSASGTVGHTPQLSGVDAYRLALLEMKAHLAVARTLLRIGTPGARYHLQRPIQEIFQRIQPQLESRNAPLTEEILAPLGHVTEAGWRTALTVLDSVDSAIDGSFAQAGAVSLDSTLGLSAALLRNAVDLYARSVANNAVVDVHGYQTGRGLVLQAEALVRHSTRLRNRAGYDALLAHVVLIRQSWPGVTPPPIVFSPQSVAERLKETMAAMDRLRSETVSTKESVLTRQIVAKNLEKLV